MSTVANFFLSAKSWQLFVLLVVGPFVADMSVMTSQTLTIHRFSDFGPRQLLYVAVTVTYMLCFLAWLWSMGSFLNSTTKSALKLRTGFFHFSLTFPIIYGPVFMLLISVPRPWSLAILPPHLLAMFCLFYVLYFVSKSLVQVETAQSASFYNFAGPFFLLWFYPVGIWIIQPRINRLFARNGSEHSGRSTLA